MSPSAAVAASPLGELRLYTTEAWVVPEGGAPEAAIADGHGGREWRGESLGDAMTEPWQLFADAMGKLTEDTAIKFEELGGTIKTLGEGSVKGAGEG